MNLFYSTLIKALNRMYQDQHEALSRKNALTDDQAADIASKRLSSFRGAKADAIRKKRRKKSQLISIRFLPLIKKLRAEGLSWRDCADYLLKYHKKR